MKVAIVCAIYCKNQAHYDLLTQTLKSIQSRELNLTFIGVENHMEPMFKQQGYHFLPTQEIGSVIMPGRQPQCLAKAWNDGVNQARRLGAEFALIINHDIVLRSNAIDILVNAALNAPEDEVLWSMGQMQNLMELETATPAPGKQEHPNFSSFMIRPSLFDIVGTFDENFTPAYFEDNDYHARISLMNKKAVMIENSLFFHYGSHTTQADPEISRQVAARFHSNREYFISKFGTTPVGEASDMRQKYFTHPYNEQDKPLSYWHSTS